MGTIVGVVFVLSIFAFPAEIKTMPPHQGADPIGSALIVPQTAEEQLSFEATGAARDTVPTSSLPQRDDDTPRQWLDGLRPSELPQVFKDLD